MFDIYLTDEQRQVQFKDYPGDHPVKFVLNFKKIFPSVMELILPVLPDDENLDEMKWESTAKDLALFQKIIQAWGVIELRLNAIKKFKNQEYAENLVRLAQQKRKAFHIQQKTLSTVELDYLFMHEIHGLIDAELVDVGEKFYLPVLRELWKGDVSEQVLNARLKS